MALLGQLHCMAQPTRLADFYRSAGYRMLTDLPPHPLLRTPAPELKRFRHNFKLTVMCRYEEDVKVRGGTTQ